ncbi:MAG: hypothetical protein H6741_02530 [Alphaproteobacteria bacterium]|nr:hypothetical protein [Alphaproteobacteria bacterium]MCB9791580.1 hypothetical protein [Alphaproteobacteria bacterium]
MNARWLIGLAALALGAGCGGPWEELPTQSNVVDALPLWSPDVIALSDGLYVQLPQARSVARVTPDGQWSTIDLQGSVPSQLIAAPDGETLLAFAEYPRCESDDPEIETVEDCVEAEEEVSYQSEIVVVRDGEITAQIPVAPHFNALTFTSDGSRAVAYLDFSQVSSLDTTGLTNYTEVLFIDLASGEATPLPVGFAADRILFNADDTRAVVLSRSQVVLVDLGADGYEVAARFPLSLDVDDRVLPDDVALTPDGRYALITVSGGSELYVIDLEQESINIVTLAQQPADMVVDPVNDRTLLVYSGSSRVDILEHQYFEIESVELEEPATGILTAPDFALLYNNAGSSYHDIYQLDPLTTELEEFRAENPVVSLQYAPNEAYAVAVTRPEGGFSDGLEGYYDSNWGVEILDLLGGRSVALVAESEPVGLAFAQDGATGLVLLDGVADLLQLNLADGASEPVELTDVPLGIGAYGNGGFYITHDAALGLVSFLDPDTGELTPVGGFAVAGLLAGETSLPARED